MLASLVLFGLAMRYFKKKGDEQTEDHFIRGVQIAEPRDLARQLKKAKKQSSFAMDNLHVFKQNFEVQHILLDGTTGAGKSVALRKLLRWVRARGDKAIIYDKGCTFVSKFYNPNTDVILNAFDERSAYWDIWCDAKEASDFENMAAALIPMHGDGDPFWVQSARTIFTSTGYRMVDESNRTTERLLELMLTSELESLNEYLKGTESASLVSDKIQKTAISIKSVLAAYIKSLRFLEGLDQKDDQGNLVRRRFSIRDWVKDDEQKGFLFLSSNAKQHASQRPLISMWLSIASTAILEQQENPDRRIWVIMDEAPSLHKLPELGETISEVRKFGGCYAIGIQSYAPAQEGLRHQPGPGDVRLAQHPASSSAPPPTRWLRFPPRTWASRKSTFPRKITVTVPMPCVTGSRWVTIPKPALRSRRLKSCSWTISSAGCGYPASFPSPNST